MPYHETQYIKDHLSINLTMSPVQKDLVGEEIQYWNDPTELAMLKTLVESQGGTLRRSKKVPNNDSNSITPIANGVLY